MVDTWVIFSHQPLAFSIHVDLPRHAKSRIQSIGATRQGIIGIFTESRDAREKLLSATHFGGNGMAVQGLETDIHQPVEGLGGIVDRQPAQGRIDGAMADAHGIFIVIIGTVLNPLGLLQPRAGRTHLA